MPYKEPKIDAAVIQTLLAQMQNMDSDQLRDAILRVGQAAGMNPRQLARAANNVNQWKRQASGMSVRDIQKFARRQNPAVWESIVAEMKKDGLL